MDEVDTRLTADGSVTLYSSRYRQTFHSVHGAASEARHVFVEGSGAGARLRSSRPCRVLEVGFGTGLNMILTAALGAAHDVMVEYVALERELLGAGVLRRLGYEGLAPRQFAELLSAREALPQRPPPGRYQLRLTGCALDLRLGEAQEQRLESRRTEAQEQRLESRRAEAQEQALVSQRAEAQEQALDLVGFDAIYHDAFSPDENPELWTSEFLSRLAAALAPGGRLVSYTVKGAVRRNLAASGLQVTKAPGPPRGKREMLVATRPAEAP